jgi:hypothetical protein
MAKFSPTQTQANIAAKVGYAIDGENKWMLRGRIGYEIDLDKRRDESFSIKADWIGPEYATDCEMKLWRALVDAMNLPPSMTDEAAAVERACRAVCQMCREGRPLSVAKDSQRNPYGGKIWHLFDEHLHRCKAEEIRKEFRT